MNNNRTTRVTVAAASALFALSALAPVPAAFAASAVKAANTGTQAATSAVAAEPAAQGTSVPFGDSGYTLRYMPNGKPVTLTKATSTYNPDKTDPAIEERIGGWKVYDPNGTPASGQNSSAKLSLLWTYPGESTPFKTHIAFSAAGDAKMECTITVNDKSYTATTPVLFTILPKSISLVWDSPADRKPNDGKKVTAKVDPKNGFYASDTSDVSIKVTDGDLQTAGSHIAQASIASDLARLRASYVINNPKLTYTIGTTTNPEPKPEPKPDPKPNPQPQPKPEDNKKPATDSNKKNPAPTTDNKKTDDKKPAANNTAKKTSAPSKTTGKNKLPQTDDQTDLQAVAAVAITGAAAVATGMVTRRRQN